MRGKYQADNQPVASARTRTQPRRTVPLARPKRSGGAAPSQAITITGGVTRRRRGLLFYLVKVAVIIIVVAAVAAGTYFAGQQLYQQGMTAERTATTDKFATLAKTIQAKTSLATDFAQFNQDFPANPDSAAISSYISRLETLINSADSAATWEILSSYLTAWRDFQALYYLQEDSNAEDTSLNNTNNSSRFNNSDNFADAENSNNSNHANGTRSSGDSDDYKNSDSTSNTNDSDNSTDLAAAYAALQESATSTVARLQATLEQEITAALEDFS